MAFIIENKNLVTFQLNEGDLEGCQLDEVIRWSKEKLETTNRTLPCRENAVAITKLDEALLWLMKRKLDVLRLSEPKITV